MKLGGSHLLLELRLLEDLAERFVRAHEHIIVVEEDVVDANHAKLSERHIAQMRRPLP